MHYTFGQCIGTFDELLGYKCIIALFFNSVHIENSGEILGYLCTILLDSVLGLLMSYLGTNVLHSFS